MSHVFLQNMLCFSCHARQQLTTNIRFSHKNVSFAKILLHQRQQLSNDCKYGEFGNASSKGKLKTSKHATGHVLKSKHSSKVYKQRLTETDHISAKVIDDADVDNDYFGLNDTSRDDFEAPVRFPDKLPRHYKTVEQGKKDKQIEPTLYGHVRYDNKPKAGGSGRISDQRNSPSNDSSRRKADSFIDDQYFAYEGNFKKDTTSETNRQPPMKRSDKYENGKLQNKFSRTKTAEGENGYDVASNKKGLGFIDSQYFDETSQKHKSIEVIEIPDQTNDQEKPSEVLDKQKIRHFDDDVNDIDRQYFVDTSVTRTFEATPIDDSDNERRETRIRKIKDTHAQHKEPENLKRNKGFNDNLPRFEKKSEKVNSAYDAAMKIRKEKESSKHINLYGEMMPKEFDSKGFKILRNQVPHFDNAPSLDVRNVLRKSILYQKDDIIAINKPYGLPMHDGPGVIHSVSDFLDSIIPRTQLYPVHRLDKETTGVMLFAKTESMAKELRDMFSERKVTKRYLAITKNIPKRVSGEIDIPLSEVTLDGKAKLTLKPHSSPDLKPVMPKGGEGTEAVTRYRILDSGERIALLECMPLTGKKHQIRVHLANGLDCPILGDHKYAHFNKLAPMRLHPSILELLNIQQTKVRHLALHLHARSIMIPKFLNGRNLYVSAWLPPHFIKNLKSLKLKLPKNM